jgi:hypothetical protein
MKRLLLLFAVSSLLAGNCIGVAKNMSTTTAPVSRTKESDAISSCRRKVWALSEFDRRQTALHGISEVCVLMPARDLPGGLKSESFKSAIEKRCRNGGLKIVDRCNLQTPILSLDLHPLYDGKRADKVAYVMDLEVSQMSILASDMKTRAQCRIYSFQRLVSIGGLKADRDYIDTEYLEAVSAFMQTWRTDRSHR